MAASEPSKKDIEIIFKRLRSVPANKFCFDCSSNNPTWASVTYGVFICIDCSAVHRSLGVHLTFVRSTLFDTNWTWLQLHKMQLGGNSNAKLFFVQHDCTTKDFQAKYNSRTAQLYKEKLENAAKQALATHGNTINLEPEPQTEDKKEDIDFFDEHTADAFLNDPAIQTGCSLSKTNLNNESNKNTLGPSVNLDKATSVRKPTIGLRSNQAKRTGLGAKRPGLGAQKITTNFADIEKEAEMADKLKEQDKKNVEEKTQETKEEEFNSMQLAYENLSVKVKKEEEKMKAVDPNKAKQMERLGMGFGSRSGVSHSALSDMKTIEQENLQAPSSKFTLDRDNDFDDLAFWSGNSSYMFKSSSESQSLSSLLEENKKRNKYPVEQEIKSSSSFETPKKSYDNANSKAQSETSTDAQKKFGAAKSISSDQYFSDKSDRWEKDSNLSRFEGSSSISSADYFGRTEHHGSRSSMSLPLQTPDLDDVKESVRQGVTKVAGKLSSLANGVMTSFQDKYGGY